MGHDTSQKKSEVIDEARTKGIKVHFASLMDICHLKNAEFETKHQKYQGRVVLRGHIVKDESGGEYSVSLHPGQNGRCTTTESRIRSLNVQTFGFVYHDTTGQNLGPVWKIQSFFLNEICMVILWQDLWDRQFEKKRLQHGWEKVSHCVCAYLYTVNKGLLLSVYVDDTKLAGKKRNLDPMWKVLNKEVDLGDPTSFFYHVYLGCTQRQCEISKDIVDNDRTMFESRISAGGLEKLPFTQNLRISSWSYDMAVHAKKCVER